MSGNVWDGTGTVVFVWCYLRTGIDFGFLGSVFPGSADILSAFQAVSSLEMVFEVTRTFNLQKAVKPRNTRNTRKNQDLILKHIYTEKVNFIKSLTA